MFTSPSLLTIGIALLVAAGLVCFGVVRLMRFFHEDFHKDNTAQESPYPLDTGAESALSSEVKRP